MKDRFPVIAEQLIGVGGLFYDRGWMLATSGNLSVVLGRDPEVLAITASGKHKGKLGPSDILRFDANDPASCGRPSAETLLHLEVVRARDAGAVLHTHSTWSTLLSEVFADRGGMEIEGYEMEKGLSGVASHEHREWLPILENSQEMEPLAATVGTTLARHRGCHGFLLRRHGLYTWGSDLDEAMRHVEAFEFLLELVGRRRLLDAAGKEKLDGDRHRSG